MIAFSWNQRIERAEQLMQALPASAEFLRFYAELARFQQRVYERLKRACSGWIDTGALTQDFLPLLRLVEAMGPPAAAEEAFRLEREQALLEDVLACAWDGENEIDGAPDRTVFFARALLQPYLECLVERNALRPVQEGAAQIAAQVDEARCPCCGGKPRAAVLRTEGTGGKRSLECSWCSSEWEFRRCVCPGCGEERNERLPVFIAAELEYVRVEACDTCGRYLKSIDLTRNGLAVPSVDEIATVSLDCWAQESGYTKMTTNALGM